MLRRLFHIGSLSESMAIYVPVTAFQRGLGLLRVLVLTWLLSPGELGLWGIGAMLFAVVSPVMTLGTGNGLARYVSAYEAARRLREFYRKVCLVVLIIGTTFLVMFLSASGPLTKFLFAREDRLSGVSWEIQLWVCWIGLINAVLLAWYQDFLAFLRGMRAYRMVSFVELLFGTGFTLLAIGALLFRPSALLALGLHALALLVAVIAGVILLHKHLKHHLSIPVEEKDDKVPPTLYRVVLFGMVVVLSTVLWNINSHMSFYLVSKGLDETQAGVYFAFLRLTQVVQYLANAAWAVLFVHVAKQWQAGKRDDAQFVLETSYKGISLVLMTLAVVVQLAAPLWVRILPSKYHLGTELVGPLLMGYQVMVHLALMILVSKIHEKPIMMTVAALAGGVGNYVFARAWIGSHGALGAAMGFAIGTYIGVGLVSVGYLLSTRPKPRVSTVVVMLLPVTLILPRPVLTVIWLIVALSVFTTPLWLTSQQKKALQVGLIGLVRRRRRG